MSTNLEHTTVELQQWLDQLQADNAAAAASLVAHAFERLRRLVRARLTDFTRVHRWEETDDVLQMAATKLYQSLHEVKPQTVRGFFGLAALQIRRILLDLARHHGGPQADGANHASIARAGASAAGNVLNGHADHAAGPVTLAQWNELHEIVDGLPQEEREVFDLVGYAGLSKRETAKLMQVSEKTVHRRWRSARIKVYQQLNGEESYAQDG